MVLFQIAIRNVLKNWRHSLAALLSISTGFVAFGLTQGYLANLELIYRDSYDKRGMMGSFVVQRKNANEHMYEDLFRYNLSLKEQNFLNTYLNNKGSEVISRVRHLFMSGTINNGKNQALFMGYGVDIAQGVVMRSPQWIWNTVAGQPLHLMSDKHILLGQGLGKKLGCTTSARYKDYIQPGGGYIAKNRDFQCQRFKLQLTTTTQNAQLNALDAEVGGLIDGGFRDVDEKWLVAPLPLAQRLLDTDTVTMMTVQLATHIHTADFIKSLKIEANRQGFELSAMPWQEHSIGEMYRRSMTILKIFRNFILAVVLAIAGMSVLNTMLKSINERVREIGTLRSLGFKHYHIVSLFTWEAVFLALLSSAVGFVLTMITSGFINALGITYKAGFASEPIPLKVTTVFESYFSAGLFLAIMAVVATYFPARKAASKNIPDALAHSG